VGASKVGASVRGGTGLPASVARVAAAGHRPGVARVDAVRPWDAVRAASRDRRPAGPAELIALTAVAAVGLTATALTEVALTEVALTEVALTVANQARGRRATEPGNAKHTADPQRQERLGEPAGVNPESERTNDRRTGRSGRRSTRTSPATSSTHTCVANWTA
jgi:hypothetical protein